MSLTTLRVALVVLGAVIPYMVSASVIYADAGSFENKYWSEWFDSDNPHGGGDNQGENETMAHIIKRLGHSCAKSVQCDNPDAMEVDFADDHMTRHPNASLMGASSGNSVPSTVGALDCMVLRPEARNPDIGFFCVNSDQVESSQACLDTCYANGLQNQYADTKPNCGRCPNVKVRFHCPPSVPKTCRTKKQLLRQVLELLEEDDLQEDDVEDLLRDLE